MRSSTSEIIALVQVIAGPVVEALPNVTDLFKLVSLTAGPEVMILVSRLLDMAVKSDPESTRTAVSTAPSQNVAQNKDKFSSSPLVLMLAIFPFPYSSASFFLEVFAPNFLFSFHQALFRSRRQSASCPTCCSSVIEVRVFVCFSTSLLALYALGTGSNTSVGFRKVGFLATAITAAVGITV
eukprot:IDg3197t1